MSKACVTANVLKKQQKKNGNRVQMWFPFFFWQDYSTGSEYKYLRFISPL